MRPELFYCIPLLGVIFANPSISAPPKSSKTVVSVQKLKAMNANKTEFSQDSASDTIDLSNAPSTYFCSGVAGYGPLTQDCNNIILETFWSDAPITFGPETVTSYTSTVSATCAIDVYNYSVDVVTISGTSIEGLVNFLVATCGNDQGFAEGTVWYNDFEQVEIDVRHA